MSESPPVPGAGPGPVPAEHAALARRLRTAEDRLYPLAMVDADRYQRAVQLVGRLAGRLAETCASLDELAAAEPRVRGWLADPEVTGGVPVAGLDPDLVVEAALAQRFRTLLSDQAAALRTRALERARAAGLAWAVLEEPDPAGLERGLGAVGGGARRHRNGPGPIGRRRSRDGCAGLPDRGVRRPGPRTGSGWRSSEDRAAWESAIEDARRAAESES